MQVYSSFNLENAVEVWGFRISEEYQGFGFGQRFLREIIGRHEKNTIILFVYKLNARALHIYEKLGFRIVGEYMCGAAWEMRLLPQN
jgi:ribosomal protein S18 acetylase RimI-like enzyme